MPPWRLMIGLIVLSFLYACAEDQDTDHYKPSEISSRISDSIMVHVRAGQVSSQDDFNETRDRFARMLVDSMQSAGLDSTEKYERATVLYWSGEREEAEKIFKELTLIEDDLARKSLVQLITIKIEGGKWDDAEEMMREYRESYPPAPEAPVSLRLCVDDLSGRYNNKDRPEDAIRVILDEINNQPFNYPYSSFSLVGELAPLMIETGKVPQLKELVTNIRENLDQSLKIRLARSASPDSVSEDFDELKKSFEGYIKAMDMLLASLDLIGRSAPRINALHVFNADSTFTMKRCTGRVTIMDFWTTWCTACVIGYVELGELYSQYSRDDLAAVGITSYQGVIYDLASGEREGSRDDPVSRDKERKYIERYIGDHKITWPCIISDRSALDPEYHINGLPTYVILDRKGIVRYMHMGVGKQRQMKRIIDRLLAGK